MTTILPELERDLHRAAERQLAGAAATPTAPAPPPPGVEPVPHRERSARSEDNRLAWRRRAGVLPVAALVLVAVVIAGGAIALLARGGSSGRSAEPILATPRQELIAHLSLLRRAQTPTARDRKLLHLALGPPVSGRAAQLRAAGDPVLEPALVRVLPVAPARTDVIVAAARYRPRGQAKRTTGVILTLSDPRGALNTNGPRPASVARFLTHGLTLIGALETGDMPGAVLVPDGVARVRLGVARLGAAGLPRDTTIGEIRPGLHATAMIAVVHDNVAILRVAHPPTLRIPGTTVSGLGLEVRIPETWYSRTGHVLRRLVIDTTIVLAVRERSGTRASGRGGR